MSIATLELTPAQFQRIRDLMYETSGVNLVKGKEELVKARLSKRIRALELDGFDDYVRFIEQEAEGKELFQMVDELTTNKTSFFREASHFDLLRDEVAPAYCDRGGKFRIWSAGCSSGEEPYTLAITLSEALPNIERRDVKILATDISPTILDQARTGVYSSKVLGDVADSQRRRYFDKRSDDLYAAGDELRSLITFALLNLMEPWPMKGSFDMIFCRNVMIYFDQSTRQRLVRRFHKMLAPGGYLCVGHSESLNSCDHGLAYVQPAVYRNEA